MNQATPRVEQVGRLSRFLEKFSRPRFQLFIILLLAGSVGVGASFLLLESGMRQMWLRYPVAAIIAYLAFLALLRLWAQFLLSNPNLPPEEGDVEPVDAGDKKSSAWDINPFDYIDLGAAFDDFPVGILILAVVTVAIIIVLILVAAPVLLAEVLLDALLVAGLWHRFNRYDHRSLGSAVRATMFPATIVVACLAVIGYALQLIDPSAESIGEMFRSQA